MKNILLLFTTLFIINCNSNEVSILGNWSLIVKKKIYQELYIDKEYIKLIDDSGIEANSFNYQFDGTNLQIPFYTYYVKYGINKNQLIFYNKKDTILLDRINIKKNNLDRFLIRKYSYLVSKNIITIDSANQTLRSLLIKGEKFNIKEINLDSQLKRE